MTLRRKRPATPVCCGAEVDRGVACPECGRVAGRDRVTPPLVPPPAVASTSVPPLVTYVRTEVARLRAVPKPAPRPPRPRRRMRARNEERARQRLVDDFGPLADAVRPLRCAVVGCDRAPSDPAHVVSRSAGGGAWIAVAGEVIGNLAPLCRGHHTGAPGFPREVIQHQVGLRAFEQNVELAVKLPGQAEQRVAQLAEVARAVGDWFRQGAPGAEGAPC